MDKENPIHQLSINPLIEEARSRLQQNPRDTMHDLEHHMRVWENCRMIVEKEGLAVNMDALKLAAFWHDVIMDKPLPTSRENVEEVCNYLEEELKDSGFDEEFVGITVATVRHHEFLDNPETIECLVLQDADKLDGLSQQRWSRCYLAYKQGKMEKERMVNYIKTSFEFYPFVLASFYFSVTVEIAKKRMEEISEDDFFADLVCEFGMQHLYDTILKAELTKAAQSKLEQVKKNVEHNRLKFVS